MIVRTEEKFELGGHRGWKAAFPENTLEGFVAVAPHVDFAEIDVRWTSDGVPILSHDPVVEGVTLAEHAADELAGLARTAHVPRFEALLAALPALRLDIELKHDPAEPGFDATMERPIRASALARPGDFISSFHWPTLAAVRRALPHVETGALVEPPVTLQEAIEEAVAVGHRWVLPHHEMVTAARQVSEMHGLGLKVGVWTVNEPSDARRLVDYGVNAIVTDDPPLIDAEVRQ